MRAAGTTVADLALALERDEYVRMWVSDSEGDLQDLSRWLKSLRIYDEVDAFAAGADVTLHREIDGESIAPLMTDPRDINGGRRILIECAFLELGEEPVEDDWIPIFDGRIDDPQWGGFPNDLTFSCRSRIAALLHDRWIEGSHIGTYSGTQQGVMQTLLDTVLGEDAPTLVVIGDPATAIPEYSQRRQSLADALRALAEVNGWVVRDRWHEASEAFRLILSEPDRDKTEADLTFSTDDFVEHGDVRLQSLGVRTVVEIEWQEGLFGLAEDTDAIALEGVGRKVMYIDATADPLITSQTQAQALAELILEDVSTALVGQGTTHGLFWRVELGDLLEYPADDTWADASRKMAVVGYEHTWSSDPETPSETRIDLRGQPSGGADRWYIRDQRTRTRNDLLPDEEIPDFEITADCPAWRYTIRDGSEGNTLESTAAQSLGRFVSTSQAPEGALFRDLEDLERVEGTTLYRTLGLVNATEVPWEGVRVYFGGEVADGYTYAVGLDPEGIVDLDQDSAQGGESADEESAPTPLSGSISFSGASDIDSGVIVGTIPTDSAILVHLRLTVAEGADSGAVGGKVCAAQCLPSLAAES